MPTREEELNELLANKPLPTLEQLRAPKKQANDSTNQESIGNPNLYFDADSMVFSPTYNEIKQSNIQGNKANKGKQAEDDPSFWDYVWAKNANSSLANRVRWFSADETERVSDEDALAWVGLKALYPNEDENFKVTQDMVVGYEEFPQLLAAGNRQQFERYKEIADGIKRRRKVIESYNGNILQKFGAEVFDVEENIIATTTYSAVGAGIGMLAGPAGAALGATLGAALSKAGKVYKVAKRPAVEAFKWGVASGTTQEIKNIIDPNERPEDPTVLQATTGGAVFGGLLSSMGELVRTMNKRTTKRLKEASDGIAKAINENPDIASITDAMPEATKQALSGDTVAPSTTFGIGNVTKAFHVNGLDQDMLSSRYQTARMVANKAFTNSHDIIGSNGEIIAQAPTVEALANKTINMACAQNTEMIHKNFNEFLVKECGYGWAKKHFVSFNVNKLNLTGNPKYAEFSQRVENVITTGVKDQSDIINRTAEAYSKNISDITDVGIKNGVFKFTKHDEALKGKLERNNVRIEAIEGENRKLLANVEEGEKLHKRYEVTEDEFSSAKELMEQAQKGIDEAKAVVKANREALSKASTKKEISAANKVLTDSEASLSELESSFKHIEKDYYAAKEANDLAVKDITGFLKKNNTSLDNYLETINNWRFKVSENDNALRAYNRQNKLLVMIAKRPRTEMDFPISKDFGYFPRKYDAAYIKRHPKEAQEVIIKAYAKQGKKITGEQANKIIEKNLAYSKNPYKTFHERVGSELERTVDVASSDLEEILVHDLIGTFDAYGKRIISDAEVMRAFGTLNPEDVILKLTQEKNALIKLLGESEKKLSPSSYRKEYHKIEEEFIRQKENIHITFDRLRGRGAKQMPLPVQVVMAWNTLRSMGMIVTAPLMDAFTIVLHQGLWRPLKQLANSTIDHIQPDKHVASLVVKTLDPEGISRIVNPEGLIDGNVISQRSRTATNWFMRASMGPTIDGILRRFNGRVAEQRILENLVAKKQSTLEAAWMRDVGITEEQQVALRELFKAHGKQHKLGSWESGYERWADGDAKRAFDAAIYKVQYETVLTPTMGARPRWMDGYMMRAFFQFKQCTFAAGSKALLPFVQRLCDERSCYAIQALSIGAAASYFRQVCKDKAAGIKDRSQSDRIEKALTELDVFAQGMFLTDIIYRVTPGRYEKYNTAFPDLVHTKPGMKQDLLMDVLRTSALTGAASDLLKVGTFALKNIPQTSEALGLSEPNYSELHAVRRMIPSNNLFFTARLFNNWEKSLGRMYDIPRYFDTKEEQKAAAKRRLQRAKIANGEVPTSNKPAPKRRRKSLPKPVGVPSNYIFREE